MNKLLVLLVDPKEIKKPKFHKDWGGESGEAGYDFAMKCVLAHAREVDIDERYLAYYERCYEPRCPHHYRGCPDYNCKIGKMTFSQFLSEKPKELSHDK